MFCVRDICHGRGGRSDPLYFGSCRTGYAAGQVENDEPLFAVSLHAVDMIYDALWGMPSILLTFEGNLNSNMSLVTRPHLIFGDYTRGKKGSPYRREIDVFDFGISEGLRFYFRSGHRGWFMAGHFVYDRVNLDYKFEQFDERNDSFKGNGFGGAFYGGHKFRSGNFTSSLEMGLKYCRYFLDKEVREDWDRVSTVGAEFDIIYTIGFAL